MSYWLSMNKTFHELFSAEWSARESDESQMETLYELFTRNTNLAVGRFATNFLFFRAQFFSSQPNGEMKLFLKCSRTCVKETWTGFISRNKLRFCDCRVEKKREVESRFGRKSEENFLRPYVVVVREKVKPMNLLRSWLLSRSLTWVWSDGDVLHQVRCDFFTSRQSNFSDFFSEFDPFCVPLGSWHPFRWKLMIKSQTDGGLAVGGGRM